jgi:hypothetical protein
MPAQLTSLSLLDVWRIAGSGSKLHIDGPLVSAAQDFQLDNTVGCRLERLEQIIRVSNRSAGRLHNQVARFQPGPRRWAVILDKSDQQAFGIGKPHGAPHATGHIDRGYADPKTRPAF